MKKLTKGRHFGQGEGLTKGLMAIFFVVGILCMSCAVHGEPSTENELADVALTFDGSSTYVETEVHAQELGIDGNAPRTAEAWVYTRGFNNGGVFYLGTANETGRAFCLRTLDGTDRWRVQYWGGPDIDFTYISDNRWVHFALVHTGSETLVYADGSEVVRESRELDTSNAEPFRIGRWWDDSIFHGEIAEVRLWDRVLSAEEIKENMNSPLQGDEEGLVGYWPLNEGTGDVAHDKVAGNHGKLAGDFEWASVRIAPFRETLPSEKQLEPGESYTAGPVELRRPEGEVNYQWYFNDEEIEGAVENTLEITDAGRDKLGTYHVVVDDESEFTPVESNRMSIPEWPIWRSDIEEGEITVSPGETITLGPAELYAPLGEVSYQWFLDDEPIENATEDSLTIDDVNVAELGTYHVEVEDESDVTPVESSRTKLPDWPIWRADLEEGKSVSPGDTVTLGPVELYAPYGEVNYQWYRNDEPIEGAEESSLQISDVTVDELGSYHVRVDDEYELTPVDSGRVQVQPVSKWVFEAGAGFASTPVTMNDVLYVGNNDGKLYAVNTQDGSLKWAFETEDAVVASPAICEAGEDVVYAASKDGNLYSLNVSDGSLKWTFETGGAVVSAPAVADGNVFVGSNDNNIYAVDAEEGTAVWTFETAGAVAPSPVLGQDGTLYAGSYDGNLYALDPQDGSQRWSFAVDGALISSPSVGDDGAVYVGCSARNIYAIDPGDGTELWRFETGGRIRSAPLAAGDGIIYAGSTDGKLYALNSDDGTANWSMSTGAQIVTTPVLGAEGTVYVCGTDKNLYAVDRESGMVKWQFRADAPLRLSSPVIAEDGSAVYVASYGGRLYAVEKFLQ